MVLVERYVKCVEALYDHWAASEEWREADAILVANGEQDEEVLYKKSTAFLIWLFEEELENTVVLCTASEVKILTTTSNAEILAALKDVKIPKHNLTTTLLVASPSDAKEQFAALCSAIKGSKAGQKVGTLIRDSLLGSFMEAWQQALATTNVSYVNIATGVATLMYVKDEHELRRIRTAAVLSGHVLTRHLLPEIEEIVDEEKTVTHSTIAEKIEDIFSDPSKISKKLASKREKVESCYTPIIQSGGVYDLRPSAVSNDDPLHFGTIICSVGARFGYYCSNVARTYFIDPSKDQETNYKLLVEIRDLLVKTLKPGVRLNTLAETAQEYIQKKRPELLPNFVKTCGFGTGIEFRESTLSLNNKNNKKAQAGMVFNLCVGLHNLELEDKVVDPKKKVYSIMLADTVMVSPEGEAKNLTSAAPFTWKEISYSLDGGSGEEEEEEEEERAPAPKKARGLPSADYEPGLRRTRLRDQDKNRDLAAEARRKKHQQELEEKKRKEAEARFLAAQNSDESHDDKKRLGDAVAYQNPAQFPKEARSGHIYVDPKRESVLLPIYGVMVPFHITTIKSISKSEDYLRINFNVQSSSASAAEKKTKGQKDSTRITYIRELTFRITDQKALNTSLRLIKEIRKRAQARATERQIMDNLVEQEELDVNARGRVPRLNDLYIRPNIGGRRTKGSLEVHRNGLRFRSTKGGLVDIIFSNIKHAFFQAAENELIAIIHFHLRNGIMVGKKKTNDVQVYVEVVEAATSLEGNNRNRGGMEKDDLEDEQRERERRQKINAEMQAFTQKIEQVAASGNYHLEFDIPYRELGFLGVHGRSSTFIQPTVNCLVQLVEAPFFVLTLDEVEIACFERVQFSLRNFDLVFVFKDLTRIPATISAIPTENLEPIKEWLDECDIKYYESPTNYNWKSLLGVIRANPKKFWEDGGWNFLNQESDDEEERAAEEEAEDAYEPSDQDDDEEDDYQGSDDDDDDAYGDEDDDEDDEDDVDEEEEEGEDWDELERKAALADRKKKFDDHVSTSVRKRSDDYSDDEDDDDDGKRPPARNRKAAPPAKRGAVSSGNKRKRPS
ncbi:FACT complex subunit [Balamuthia mandrillaris]